MKVKLEMPKITIDASALNLNQLLDICKQEALNTTARLKSETGQGRDADGGALKSYSPEYAKRKAYGKVRGAGGVRGTGGSKTPAIGPVNVTTNLTVTGELLGSMQVRQVADGAEIFFLGDHASKGGKLTNVALAGYLIAKGFKDWFGFGIQDEARINNRFAKFVDSAVKKLIVVK